MFAGTRPFGLLLWAMTLVVLGSGVAVAGHLRWNVVRRTARVPVDPAIALLGSAAVALGAGEDVVVLAASGRTSLAVLDARTLTLRRSVHTGDAADNIVPADGGNTLVAWAGFGRRSRRQHGYIAADEVFLVDGASGRLRHRVRVGQNVGDVVDLGDGTVIVSAVQGRRVSRLSLSTGAIISQLDTRRFGVHPGSLVVRADRALAVVNGGVYQVGRGRQRAIGHRFLVLDPKRPAERARVDTYYGFGHPRGPMFHPDGRHVLVADRGEAAIVVVDWVTRRVVDRIPVGAKPERVVRLPGGHLAWLEYDLTKRVTRVDLNSGAVRDARLPGRRSGPAAPSADGTQLYVPTAKPAGVAVVDTESWRTVDHIRLAATPQGLAVSRDGRRVYVAMREGRYVSILE